MSEYKDLKNNVYKIKQTSLIAEAEKSETELKIVDALLAIFKK